MPFHLSPKNDKHWNTLLRLLEHRRVFACDIGNTRLKLDEVTAQGVVRHLAISTPRGAADEAAVMADLRCVQAAIVPDSVLLVTSVVSEALARLKNGLADTDLSPPHIFGGNTDWPLSIEYSTPHTLGADRVMACFGAWRLYPEGAIVVDAGSAMTVDWVDGDGLFRGGSISPGVGRLGTFLARSAPELSELLPKPRSHWPATSSKACIEAGVTLAAAGVLKEHLRAARSVAGGQLPLVVTGGDAALCQQLAPSIAMDIQPDLLAWSMALAYAEGNASASELS